MGEIAEMMLDGTLCESCGEFIGSDLGFTQYCSPECAASRGAEYLEGDHAALDYDRHEKVSCPKCGKRVKAVGLWQHERDVHT